MNLLDYLIGKMFKIYLNHPLIVDLLLIFVFAILYYFLDYPYFKLPEFLFSVTAIP